MYTTLFGRWLCPFLFVISLPRVQAENITWIGTGSNNDMQDPNNWSPASVPIAGDTAIFDSTVSNINTSPTDNSAPFSVDAFQFPNSASPFTFNIENQSLSFTGAGITGTNTNPTLNISNTNNTVRLLSSQLTFPATTSSSGSASIYLTNSGTQSGNVSNSTLSEVDSQFSSSGPFSIIDNGKLTWINRGEDSTTGMGGNQTSLGNFLFYAEGPFTVGNHVSLTCKNIGVYSGTNSSLGNEVGTLGGWQIFSQGSFQAGDFFNLKLKNKGIDSGSGIGGNLVATTGFQALIEGSFTVGDHATISLVNKGVCQGHTSTNFDNVAILSWQTQVSGTFQAGDFLNLKVKNRGIDQSSGIGGNEIGLPGEQAIFGTFSVGDDARISIVNKGTSDSVCTNPNLVAYMLEQQMEMDGPFSAGKNLQMRAKNIGINTGNPNNLVGYVGENQFIFYETFTADDGLLLSASNRGTVLGSQIVLSEGFTLTGGKGKIRAINRGTLGGYGLDIQGSSLGGNVDIVLKNNTMNVDTTLSTFTIRKLNGNKTSFVQSNPTLLINTPKGARGDFQGVIQDFPATQSSVTKQGSGKQTLSGNNTYTGLTTIQGGTLNLTGSLAGEVTIHPAGTLTGNGSVGGAVVNQGTIAPGNSIGTLTFLDNFTNLGGDYTLEVKGKESDLIQVGGTATLEGGTVKLLTSRDYAFGNRYTILKAADVVGKYSQVVAPPHALINPLLSYDPTHVYLTLQTAIEQIAKTHNQRVVARELDGIENATPVQNLLLSELVTLSPSAARKALDSLSGYQQTDALWTTTIQSRQFIRRLYDPLRQQVTHLPACSCLCHDWSLWLEGGGGFSTIKGNNNAPHHVKRSNYEVTAGLQKTFYDNLTVGVAGSYEHGHLYHSRRGHSDTGFVGLYGLYRPNSYYGLADLSYGYSHTTLHRTIEAGDLRYQATSHPNLSEITFYGEFGYDVPLCFSHTSLLLQPFVGIEAGGNWRGEVREHQPQGWGLSLQRDDRSHATSRLGIHLTLDRLCDRIDISFDGAWNYLLSRQKNSLQERFTQFGSQFALWGVNLDRNSIDYACTISAHLSAALNAYVEVVGESWRRATTVNFVGGVQYSW